MADATYLTSRSYLQAAERLSRIKPEVSDWDVAQYLGWSLTMVQDARKYLASQGIHPPSRPVEPAAKVIEQEPPIEYDPHSTPEPTFACAECGKEFASKQQAQGHANLAHRRRSQA